MRGAGFGWLRCAGSGGRSRAGEGDRISCVALSRHDRPDGHREYAPVCAGVPELAGEKAVASLSATAVRACAGPAGFRYPVGRGGDLHALRRQRLEGVLQVPGRVFSGGDPAGPV